MNEVIFYNKRIMAYLIDVGIYLGLSSFIANNFAFDDKDEIYAIFFCVYLIFIIYQVVIIKLNNGQGIGGLLLGLQIKSLNGQKITWFQSMIRAFLLVFGTHVLWITVFF